PDRFVLDKGTLAIQERVISVKDKVMATLARDGAGQSGPRAAASLDDGQVVELGQLGLRVEQFFRMPCDIEWALSQGRFFLLQARAVKGAPGETGAPGSPRPASPTPPPRRPAPRQKVRRPEDWPAGVALQSRSAMRIAARWTRSARRKSPPCALAPSWAARCGAASTSPKSCPSRRR